MVSIVTISNQLEVFSKQQQEINTKMHDDVLTHVFDFLTSSTLVHTASIVNRQWNQCAKQRYVWAERTIELRTSTYMIQAIEYFKCVKACRFTVRNPDWLDALLPEMYEHITVLQIQIQTQVTPKLQWKPKIFPKLYMLQFCSNSLGIIQELLPFTPELTTFYGFTNDYYVAVDDLENRLLKCNKIKYLALRNELDGSYVLDLFRNLPLESVRLRLTSHTDPSIWNQIAKMEGVKERFESLHIEDSDDWEEYRGQPADYTLNLISLKMSLCAGKYLPPLYSCSSTLQYLDLSSVEKNLQISGLCLPNLQKLYIQSVDSMKSAKDLISCSGPNLKVLSISYLQCSIDEALPVFENSFPNMKELYLEDVPLNFLVPIMTASKCSTSFTILYFSQLKISVASEVEMDLSATFAHLTSLDYYSGPAVLFNHLPDAVLGTLTHIDLQEKLLVSDEELGKNIVNMVAQCNNLVVFSAPDMSICLAPDWIPRLLSLRKLRTLNFKKVLCSDEENVNVVVEEASESLWTLGIHGSYFASLDLVNSLIPKLPMLMSLTVTAIPKNSFPRLIELLSELESLCQIQISLADGPDNRNQLQSLPFLGKRLVNSELLISGQVPLIDFILIAICVMHGAETSQIVMTEDVQESNSSKMFQSFRLDSGDKTPMYRNRLRSMIPAVVKRITGITEQQRTDICKSLTETEKPNLLEIILLPENLSRTLERKLTSFAT